MTSTSSPSVHEPLETAAPRIMVDTNVWLDVFLPQRSRREEALRFMRLAISQECELLFTLHTLCDVYAKVGIYFKRWVRESKSLDEGYSMAIRQLAWDSVNRMDEIATLVGANKADLWVARKMRSVHDDLEDDLILAACERAGADYLVTNDKALATDAPLAALSPTAMTKVLEMRSGL